MDPELASALASHPIFSQPLQPPPEGVSPAEYERQGAEALHGTFIKFHEERLPPGKHRYDEALYTVHSGDLCFQSRNMSW